VVLESDNTVYVSAPGTGANTPRIFWSNASQAFVVNYKWGADLTAIDKFGVAGQVAGGVTPVPTLQSDNNVGSNGAVGESGTLLGVDYMGSENATGDVGLTILDENGALVGAPILLAHGDPNLPWTSIAGTAQGFVCFYDQAQQAAGAVFVSTSPDAGIVGATGYADGGIGALPSFSLPGKIHDARTISDNVGTGGKGGIGVALVLDDGSVSFAYVNADGMGHQGPFKVFAKGGGGGGATSLTNFNGSFAIATYNSATNSTQIVASGICP
jgi:hypothetical protein